MISTEACNEYLGLDKDSAQLDQIPDQLINEYTIKIHEIERLTQRLFGNISKGKESNNLPLLLSVRSGASVSMPGMMDTILNLGLNDDIVCEMIKVTNNPRFVYDIHRRFLAMFGNVVLGVRKESYEEILTDVKLKKGISCDQELSISDLQQIITSFKEIAMPPDDPNEQLKMAIQAVFNSWYTPRAIAYREINNIPHSLGTAVCIQSMVYGNMNNKSGSGVLFTRDPVTGENVLYGEYLINSEGEDVVSGSHTPMKLDDLKRSFPSIYTELVKTANVLEKHYRDMQDIEFTVENNKLHILQTRRGKR